MPLTNYSEYITKLSENRSADFQTNAATVSGRNGRMSALFPAFLPTPTVQTTSVARDKDSPESIGPIPATSSGILTILGARLSTSNISGVGAGLIVVDLLNISGGLNPTLTTEQTTGLPTAALTRYTNGEGVMVGLILYVQNGSIGTTVTIRYTNQAGTPNRVSTATTFASTGFREQNTFILIPLAAGDTGVRSVEGVTFASSTASNGNTGVCLFKPLTMISLESATGAMPLDSVSTGGIINSLAEVNPNACLTLLTIPSSSQLFLGSVILGEV